MNKKASEKINAGIYLLYLTIIAAGVIVIVGMYANSTVDVRAYESNILYNRIMNCMVDTGFVKEDIFKEDFSVFSACGLNKSAIDKNGFYFVFSFLNNTEQKVRRDIVGGDQINRESIRMDCEVIKDKSKNSHACLFKNESYFYLNDSKINEVKIVAWVSSQNEGVRDA